MSNAHANPNNNLTDAEKERKKRREIKCANNAVNSSDETFFHAMRVVLPPTAKTEPRYLTLNHLQPPYDAYQVLNVMSYTFPIVWPRLNNANVPIVIRCGGDTWNAIRALSSEPWGTELADHIRHIDFVGYSKGPRAPGEHRLEFDVVELCRNLEIVTIDIDIDDCLIQEERADGTWKREARPFAELDEYYQFSKLLPYESEDLKQILQFRFVGDEITWKRQLTTVQKELKEEMKGWDVEVVELKPAGVADPYIGVSPPNEGEAALARERRLEWAKLRTQEDVENYERERQRRREEGATRRDR